MLVLIAAALLLLAPLVMLFLHLARPRSGYQWLLALLGASAAWVLVLISRSISPRLVSLVAWAPESLFSVSPALLLDPISWSYGFALATLCLATILTAVSRLRAVNWRAWASALSLTALGLLAVSAANPLTLLLAWTALDLVEVIFFLLQDLQSSQRERVIIAFSARVLGIAVLLSAAIMAYSRGILLSFEAIPAQISPLLLLSASLRLGIVPLQAPLLVDFPLRRGMGTVLRLVPSAASLMLLTRTAAVGVPQALAPYFLAFASLAVLYSGMSWLTSENEISGRPYWIIGFAGLAVAAAIRLQPVAALAWGVAGLLAGGQLFLSSARHRRLTPVFLLGLLGISALPFTPAWGAALIYTASTSFWEWGLSLLFALGQILLLLGYLRHAISLGPPAEAYERWMWAVYLPGLVLLPASHWIIGGMSLLPVSDRSPMVWLAGILIFLLGGLLWLANWRSVRFKTVRTVLGGSPIFGGTLWGKLLSLQWFYRFLWWAYHRVGVLFAGISQVLEGDGAILWALLFLILFFSFSLQFGR